MKMTTNGGQTPHGLPQGIERLGVPSAQSSSTETSARETRLKRIVLVGALASFLSFFGLTIVMDHQDAQGTSGTTTIAASTASERQNRAPVVTEPQIRTRTS
jgi:hypothetical protein